MKIVKIEDLHCDAGLVRQPYETRRDDARDAANLRYLKHLIGTGTGRKIDPTTIQCEPRFQPPSARGDFRMESTDRPERPHAE